MKFVKWDIFRNIDSFFGFVVLAQDDKGVPIGGFLSAHLCVLWGVSSLHSIRQSLLFEDDVVEERRRSGTDSFCHSTRDIHERG